MGRLNKTQREFVENSLLHLEKAVLEQESRSDSFVLMTDLELGIHQLKTLIFLEDCMLAGPPIAATKGVPAQGNGNQTGAAP